MQGSYDNCTTIGDEVVITIMMMVVMMMCISLSFYAWPIAVRCMGVGLGDAIA